MNKIYALTFLLALLGCRPEFVSHNPYTWQPKEQKFFSFAINSGKIPKNIERNEMARLVNYTYPIELALYDDHTFYYYLENLGDGRGTWSHQDGFIELYAERKLFAMKIGLHSISDDDNRLVIDFVDRFGTQYLEMEYVEGAKGIPQG